MTKLTKKAFMRTFLFRLFCAEFLSLFLARDSML